MNSDKDEDIEINKHTSHYKYPGGVCPQLQGWQCGAYVGAVEEMMSVVYVSVTKGA